MHPQTARRACPALITFVLLAVSAAAAAGPWAPAGDTRLRHDLQLLADHGLLHAPLTTWPLTLGDIAARLNPPGNRTTLSPAVRAALDRVRHRLRRERRTGTLDLGLSASVAEKPTRLRGFDAGPREEAEIAARMDWMGRRFALRLQGSAVHDPEDDRSYRLDGSYAGLALGNWMFSVGAQRRWWGPGWDGSLILGDAARPVPAVTIERNRSDPFDLPVLRWLGPWKLVTFMGQLESGRAVPDAKLFGMRLTIKPTDKLEISAVRTAQWGGKGRPEDLDSFGDLLAGHDNVGDDGIDEDNEPGNQLGGIDFRWQSPLIGRLPYALYGQLIGEDEAGSAPSHYMALAGIEHWGGIGGASYRLYLEAADTACSFDDDPPLYNCAYEHGIYRSGYRYRGRPLGHALDNDSRQYSLGLVVAEGPGRLWGLRLQRAELNRDGAGTHSLSPGQQTEVLRAFATHGRRFLGGELELGLGAERWETDTERETEPQGFLRWSANWN